MSPNLILDLFDIIVCFLLVNLPLPSSPYNRVMLHVIILCKEFQWLPLKLGINSKFFLWLKSFYDLVPICLHFIPPTLLPV